MGLDYLADWFLADPVVRRVSGEPASAARAPRQGGPPAASDQGRTSRRREVSRRLATQLASKADDFEVTYQVREAFTHKGREFGKGDVVSPYDPLVQEVFEVRPDLFLVRSTRRPYYHLKEA